MNRKNIDSKSNEPCKNHGLTEKNSREITSEPTDTEEIRTFGDIYTLLECLGEQDGWSSEYVPQGDEYRLNDGNSVWIGSHTDHGVERDTTYIFVGNEELYARYCIEKEIAVTLLRDGLHKYSI